MKRYKLDYSITALSKPERIINKYFKVKNYIIQVEDVAFQLKGEIYYQVRFLIDSYRTYATWKMIKAETIRNPYISINKFGNSTGEIDWNYPNIEKLKTRYDDMFNRCYNPNDNNYKRYGYYGITVNPLWYCFETYVNDIIQIKGFHPALLCEDNRIQLDKDYLQLKKEGKQDLEYSKYTCTWLLMEMNSGLQKREGYKFKLESKNGNCQYFNTLTEVEDWLKDNAPKSLDKYLMKKKRIQVCQKKTASFQFGVYHLYKLK